MAQVLKFSLKKASQLLLASEYPTCQQQKPKLSTIYDTISQEDLLIFWWKVYYIRPLPSQKTAFCPNQDRYLFQEQFAFPSQPQPAQLSRCCLQNGLIHRVGISCSTRFNQETHIRTKVEQEQAQNNVSNGFITTLP